MAAFEIEIPEGDYENKDAVQRVINYICRLDKPEQVGGMGVYPLYIKEMAEQFHRVKQIYHKEKGKQVFHIIISFDRSLSFTVDEVMRMGYKIAEYWGYDRQVMFAVHDDTQNIHIHVAINTVAFTNGEYKAFFPIEDVRQYVNDIVQKEISRKWFGKQ